MLNVITACFELLELALNLNLNYRRQCTGYFVDKVASKVFPHFYTRFGFLGTVPNISLLQCQCSTTVLSHTIMMKIYFFFIDFFFFFNFLL
jgi:hypothetical protein